MIVSANALPDVLLDALCCPVCDGALNATATGLACAQGHSFDRAHQGYVNLRLGHGVSLNADTPAMVHARASVQHGPVLARVRQRVAELAAGAMRDRGADTNARVSANLNTDADADAYASADASAIAGANAHIVVDLACGTGAYLASVLDQQPYARGIGIDLSTSALKRAARCHPRAVAIGADLRGRLPLKDGVVDMALSIFGPRNVDEIHRILGSNGMLLVVAPTQNHLAELIAPLGMVHVHPEKRERLAQQFADFREIYHEDIEYSVSVDRSTARALVQMGPSAHHIDNDELESRLDALPNPTTVTVSVMAQLYAK